MSIDKHPSRRPSPPRAPPKTSTTDGQANTVSKTFNGAAGEMQYGSRNGKDMNLHIVHDHGSERSSDFMAFAEGKARKAGHEHSDEGESRKDYHASRPGDEKHNDEPG